MDRGEEPASFSEEIIQRSLPRTRARIERLQTQLHVLDVDHAARLRVIDEMAAKLEASEADRTAQLKAIDQLNQQLGESEARRADLAQELEASQTARADLAQRLEASEADRASRLEVILSLQRQITELATTKASLKRVAAAVARRLGIFHFLKRRQQRLERVYDVLYRIVSRAQKGPPEK